MMPEGDILESHAICCSHVIVRYPVSAKANYGLVLKTAGNTSTLWKALHRAEILSVVFILSDFFDRRLPKGYLNLEWP